MNKHILNILLLLGISLPGFTSAAHLNTWVGGDGNWNDPTMWSFATVPTAFEWAIFTDTADTVTSNSANVALELSNNSHLEVTGGTLNVTGTIQNTNVGFAPNSGIFQVRSGADVTAGRVINDHNSTVSVTNNGSTLQVTQGIFNSWIIEATDMGSITSESIDNSHILNVLSDGTIETNSVNNTASGVINVQGTGSSLTVTDPNGLLNNGSATASDSGRISAGSIDNNDSIKALSGGRIEANSIINNGTLEAQNAGSSIAVTGSLTNNSNLTASDSGAINSFSIDNHATLNAISGGDIAISSIINFNTGTVNVQGAGSSLIAVDSITNQGTVDVKGDSSGIGANTYLQQAGKTTLRDSGLITANNGFTIDGGLLEGNGTLAGDASFNAGSTLSPGLTPNQAGLLAVTGDASLGGLALFEVGGAANFDVLTIGGTGSVGGTLNVSLFDEFEPFIGQSFDIILASAIIGVFDITNLPIFSGRTFDVIYGATFVRLTTSAVPLPPAIWLLGTALAGLFGISRTRRKGPFSPA